MLSALVSCSKDVKNEIINIIKHPHTVPAEIRWNSADSMLKWSLGGLLDAGGPKAEEFVFTHGERLSTPDSDPKP